MRLDIRNLTFGYLGQENILRALNLFVADGETVAIIGPSGAGKTTLLRVVAGFLTGHSPSHLTGEILFDGGGLAITERKSGKLGYVFQTPTLLPHLSVIENLVFPFHSRAERAEKSRGAGKELLDRVGLARYADFYPEQLSLGMRARVALARAFVTRPTFLLLDEPFSALDVGWRLALYQAWFAESRQRRMAALLVTHDIAEAFLLASRIFVLGATGEIAHEMSSQTSKPERIDLESLYGFYGAASSDIEQARYFVSKESLRAFKELAA